MLKAIIHSKAGRIDNHNQDSIRWSEAFKHYEDLLTAAFFGRFAYLSEPVQNLLLLTWFKNQPTGNQYFYGFKDIKFWPNFKKVCDQRVEPDILMQFEHCNIIIEVKPPQGGDQYFAQWKNEVDAFLNQPEHSDKPLHFLAIGRIKQDEAADWFNALKLHTQGQYPDKLELTSALKWQPVTNTVIKALSGTKLKISRIDERVLKDMLQALKLYGLNITSYDWNDLSGSHMFNSKIHLNHSKLFQLNRSENTFKPKKLSSLHNLPEQIQQLPTLNLQGISKWTKI